MSGSVKKIFTVLIVMVACVMTGALVLNVLLPNVTTTIVDALENMVYNATGMKFDWNGNSSNASGGNTDFSGDAITDDKGTAIDKGGDNVAGLG